MKRSATLFTLPTILLTPSLGFGGQDVTLDQLPAPVRHRRTGNQGGKITDIERDEERGQTIYEVEFALDSREYELDISTEGELLERRLD